MARCAELAYFMFEQLLNKAERSDPYDRMGWLAPVYVAGSNLDVFKEISNNVWPKPMSYNKYGEGGMFYVWPKWSDSDGFKDPKEWDAYAQVSDESYENPSYNSLLMPARGTTASSAGGAVKGVWTDFYGHLRPRSGNVTAGAVQSF